MIEFLLWHGLIVIATMSISFVAGYVTRELLYKSKKR